MLASTAAIGTAPAAASVRQAMASGGDREQGEDGERRRIVPAREHQQQRAEADRPTSTMTESGSIFPGSADGP